MSENDTDYVPVTLESCQHVAGPFFHGTRAALEVGEKLVPGHGSNFHQGRVSNNIYFAGLLEGAVWGAELSTALAASEERGRIYVVEPLGPFEDDPNLTDKKFPGNPTKSYRSKEPVRVIGELWTWHGHAPDVLQAMKDNVARLAALGVEAEDD